MILDANLFAFNQKTNTYSAEMSTLGFPPGTTPNYHFTMLNCPKEGQHRSFRYIGPDIHNQEIAGLNYIEADGPNKGRSWEQGHPPIEVPPIKVLIIND